MTPRRAQAWLYHGTVQQNKELAALLNIIRAGSLGDKDSVKKLFKDLTSDVL